jgi:hypothetical protein
MGHTNLYEIGIYRGSGKRSGIDTAIGQPFVAWYWTLIGKGHRSLDQFVDVCIEGIGIALRQDTRFDELASEDDYRVLASMLLHIFLGAILLRVLG